MKLFNTALLLLSTSVLNAYALTLDAGTPIKAVSSGQPANATQVMLSNNTSTMEKPESLPTGGYSPIGPGPVPVAIDENSSEEDCDDDDSTEDDSEESGSSTMTPGTSGDDDSTMGTGAHGSGASDAGHGGAGSSSDGMDAEDAPSAALPLTTGYNPMGSPTASMRPTSMSSHSGRPISTVFPPIASSANSTDGSTSDASSVQKISTAMAAAVAVAVMMAN
ncbi:hypothetical protein BC943DRAFT_332858 [Umbelopsis sp. AD052]|nr:hypothetical protein BC943DRAFT_332858 [Umbelopsis sp. AD052]